MAIHPLRLIAGISLLLALTCIAVPAVAEVSLDPADVSWETHSSQVQFHLRFRNLDPLNPSGEVSGTVKSQVFGVYNPDYGTIGPFVVPPIEPESFFDVFLDVPLSSLPPSAGGIFQARPGRVSIQGASPPGCPRDDHWDGNIDIFWAGAGGPAMLQVHKGTMQVCPGWGTSYLHIRTSCVGWATWAIAGVAPGFTVSLLNEQPANVPDGAAPANLAPGWSGFIAVTAAANVPVGTQCCFTVTFTCLGAPAVINACVTTCDCTITPTQPSTWGQIRNIYR
jgi:hypothetical protein